MSIEELNDAIKNPDFLSISGSRLYGTNTPESDYDYRGFVFPPFEYLIGVEKFNCAELEGDHKVYSAYQFINLAIKGDPLCIELLFSPECSVLALTERGRQVLGLREDLLSMAIYGRIFGYSISEWRKAMAIKIIPAKRKKEKEELIDDIRNLYSPDKENMDEIVRILDSFDEKIVVPSFSGIGEKRKIDVSEFGYCRKSACHSIRLLGQLIEIMETGKIVFPRPNADMLRDIRMGKFSKEELQEIYDSTLREAENKKESSILPKSPNLKKIWEKYKEIVRQILV